MKILIAYFAVNFLIPFSTFAQPKPSEIVVLRAQITFTNIAIRVVGTPFFQVNTTNQNVAAAHYEVPAGKVFMITDISANVFTGKDEPQIAQYLHESLDIHTANGTNWSQCTFFNVGFNVAANVHFTTPIPVMPQCYLSHIPHYSSVANMGGVPEWADGEVILRGYLVVE